MSEQITLDEVLELVSFEKIGGKWQVLAITGSLSLLEVLSEMKVYIEETEECIDGEWGLRRGFDEIHKAGEVTKNYDLICAIIAANHRPNMR